MDQIPYIAHESDMTRMERTNRRLWILSIILIALLLLTNAGWLYYESQFQYFENTVKQEVETGEGDATVIGIGDYNGEGETDNNK